MTDMTLTDLGPFFRRYNRRNRFVLGAAVAASVAMSATTATRLLSTGGSGVRGPGVVWGEGVVLAPLVIAAWWACGELIAHGRRKASPADGSHPAGDLDARNGVRIAMAGFVFSLALVTAMIAMQASMALLAFGYQFQGELIGRAITIAMGLATIYLGNLWPRMPTARTAWRQMQVNRFWGWMMVIAGLLVVLLGLFLPLLYPVVRSLPA